MSTTTEAPGAPRMDPGDPLNLRNEIHQEALPVVATYAAVAESRNALEALEAMEQGIGARVARLALEARAQLGKDLRTWPQELHREIVDAQALLTAIAAAAALAGGGKLEPFKGSIAFESDLYHPGVEEAWNDLDRLVCMVEGRWPAVTREDWDAL